MKTKLLFTLLFVPVIMFAQQPLQINLSTLKYGEFDVPCFGATNGYVFSFVSGGTPPYNYNWNYNTNQWAYSQYLYGAQAGTVTLHVVDANNNYTFKSIVLTQPDPLTVDLIVDMEPGSCNGNDGKIVANVSGGSQAYSYNWAHDPGNSGSFAENLSSGIYYVTVTDANNCPEVTNMVILNHTGCPPFTINFQSSDYSGYNISCPWNSDGFVTAEVTGGMPPYNYSWWPNGETTPELINIPAGEYILNVTDALNQVHSDTMIMIQPDPISVTLSEISPISAYGMNDGAIGVFVTGGVPPYSYLWSNNDTLEFINNCSSGSYAIGVTDVSGCSQSANITISQPDSFLIDSLTSPLHNGKNISCKGGNDGSIDLTVQGGVPPYHFFWNTGNLIYDSPNIHIPGLRAGEYIFYIVDAHDILISDTLTLTEPDAIDISLTPLVFPNGRNLSCHDCGNGSITAVVSGGLAPYTLNWYNGQSGNIISNLAAGDYYLEVTDLNNCYNRKAIHLYAPERDDWTMTGNTSTNPSFQFIGTKDSTDFVFRTNNIERIRILGNGVLRFSGLSGNGANLLSADSYGNLSRSNMINYQGAINSKPEIFNYGQAPLFYPYNLSGTICNMPQNYPTAYQFNGMLQSYGNSATGGQTNILQMGFDGQNGVVEMLGVNSGPVQPRLLMNYYCGADVIVGNNSSGDLYAAHNFFTSGFASIGTEVASIHRLNVQGGNVQIGFNQVTTPGTNEAFLFLGDQNHYIKSESGKGVTIGTFGHPEALSIEQGNGNVGIGVDDPLLLSNTDFKLQVNGGIRASLVQVYEYDDWPDFVFEVDYKKMNLSDLELFIKKNKHLPGIPSRDDVKENGIDIADMQAKLLRKIEELTLYVLEIKKENQELKAQVNLLKK